MASPGNSRANSPARDNRREIQENDDLTLSLSIQSIPTTAPPPPPPPQNPNQNNPAPPDQQSEAAVVVSPRRNRRAPLGTKSETITPPFRWATDRRATVHTLKYLVSNGITSITGEVKCKKCESHFDIEYNLEEKFKELATFIMINKDEMDHRASKTWMNPTLPKCNICNRENCAKPVISSKKRGINWLFLVLGQMVGCCTLSQLKYFCKHTKNHRTGAKDRLLFTTYLSLARQLVPDFL